ncbi:MAG: hypothetical protein II649_12115 [Kiritimatiellae bacterium]|nr:hypothetical protein [Kiritimatiellia bacterium]
MSARIFYNNRNEAASTDGTRWWSGTDADETSISFGLLQPVSALFPPPRPGAAGAIPDSSVVKARTVFIAALRKSAPAVAPGDDAERAILRKAWDDATAFAAEHKVLASAVPVFDAKLGVVGTADALVAGSDGATYPCCYAPQNYEWREELNVVTHVLHAGLPLDCADDPFGRWKLRAVGRALLALVMRNETPWAVAKWKEAAF